MQPFLYLRIQARSTGRIGSAAAPAHTSREEIRHETVYENFVQHGGIDRTDRHSGGLSAGADEERQRDVHHPGGAEYSGH